MSVHGLPRSDRRELFHAFGALIASAWLLFNPSTWAAECPQNAAETEAFCNGNPCTINQNHTLTDGCTLDFGSKTVTIAGGVTLQSELPDQGDITIIAGSLTHRGLMLAPGGVIEIRVSGDFAAT